MVRKSFCTRLQTCLMEWIRQFQRRLGHDSSDRSRKHILYIYPSYRLHQRTIVSLVTFRDKKSAPRRYARVNPLRSDVTVGCTTWVLGMVLLTVPSFRLYRPCTCIQGVPKPVLSNISPRAYTELPPLSTIMWQERWWCRVICARASYERNMARTGHRALTSLS